MSRTTTANKYAPISRSALVLPFVSAADEVEHRVPVDAAAAAMVFGEPLGALCGARIEPAAAAVRAAGSCPACAVAPAFAGGIRP